MFCSLEGKLLTCFRREKSKTVTSFLQKNMWRFARSLGIFWPSLSKLKNYAQLYNIRVKRVNFNCMMPHVNKKQIDQNLTKPVLNWRY